MAAASNMQKKLFSKTESSLLMASVDCKSHADVVSGMSGRSLVDSFLHHRRA